MSVTALLAGDHLDDHGSFDPGIVNLGATIQWPEVCWPHEGDPYGHRSTGEGSLLVFVAWPVSMAREHWLNSPLSHVRRPLELVGVDGPIVNRFLENDWAAHPGEPWDDWEDGLAASHLFGITDRSLYSDLRAAESRSGYFSVGRENLTEYGAALYDNLAEFYSLAPTLVTALERGPLSPHLSGHFERDRAENS